MLSQKDFFQNLIDSALFSQEEFAALVEPLRQSRLEGDALAERLISGGKLTRFQADAVRERRFEELLIGNYQVLDRLARGPWERCTRHAIGA